MGRWIDCSTVRQESPNPEPTLRTYQYPFRFWQNAIKTATEPCQRRFIKYFERYTDAVVQQSSDRNCGHVRDIKSYFSLRRETIGTLPSFALIELHFNIPDRVMEHPTIQRLTDLCTDMISIGNDLYSYNAE